MEQRGAVNRYTPYKGNGKAVYTINLSNGTTPFMKQFNGAEYSSNFYRCESGKINVTHAWYRPTREEFDILGDGLQDHVLNGGLCIAELPKAQPLPNDPVEPDWDYERFQAFCLRIYGKRRGPLELHGV